MKNLLLTSLVFVLFGCGPKIWTIQLPDSICPKCDCPEPKPINLHPIGTLELQSPLLVWGAGPGTISFSDSDFILTETTKTLGVSIEAVANPGSITVSWAATYDREPRTLTIAIFYARRVGVNVHTVGVYSWDAYSGNILHLEGERTIANPPQGSWAIVVASICERAGPERDQYECIDGITSEPIKLKK